MGLPGRKLCWEPGIGNMLSEGPGYMSEGVALVL